MEAFQLEEQREEQKNAVRLEIYDMLLKYHDFRLVKRNESQNENTIYHLCSNGKITFQKGGDIYLQRNEFGAAPLIIKNLDLDITKFIYKIPYDNYGSFSYCVMVTRENAFLIRNKMLELEKLM
jgi:hypothetical protein